MVLSSKGMLVVFVVLVFGDFEFVYFFIFVKYLLYVRGC